MILETVVMLYTEGSVLDQIILTKYSHIRGILLENQGFGDLFRNIKWLESSDLLLLSKYEA
jgi:hypothetical protein